MPSEYTHLTFLLDRSGSMQALQSAAIQGFNKLRADQLATPGRITLSLIQFDNAYEPQTHFQPLAEVPPLTEQTFVPRGTTALLDALGRSIDETGASLAALPEAERPARVIFAILTDGLENASVKETWQSIHTRITRQQDAYKWVFLFLGANQDAIATAAQMGVRGDQALTFANDGSGAEAALNSTSKIIHSAREWDGVDVAFSPAFTPSDRAKQERKPKRSKT